MPFQSEAQRRYLWANEPEIARDWTDTYGSRIEKNDGGISQLVKSGLGRPGYNGQGDTGTYGQAGQSYGDQERYRSVDVKGPPNIHGGTTRTIGPTTPKDTFQQSWTGQPGIFGIGGGYRNLKTPGDTSQGHQSRFGLGSLLRGAMGMFGGWPGKIGSMLSHIDPRQLRGKNPAGGWNTQRQYEDARNLRRDEKRMAYLSDRRKRGLDFGDQAYADLLAGQGYSGKAIEDPFQNAIDKHSIDADPNAQIQATSFEQNLPENIKALNTYNDMIPGLKTEFFNQDQPGPWNNFTPGGGIMEIDTETDDDGKNILEYAKEINERIRQQQLLRELTSSSIHPYDKNQPSFIPLDERINAEDIYKKRFP
jgi:hypothetical protein